jgi:hypothetical protein
MNNTPTPRTDAELFLSRGMGIVPTLPKEVVRVAFSRTLERELTAVTEQRNSLIKAIEPLEYWRDISECDCSCPLPQGGCLRCDLNRILKLTKPKA